VVGYILRWYARLQTVTITAPTGHIITLRKLPHTLLRPVFVYLDSFLQSLWIRSSLSKSLSKNLQRLLEQDSYMQDGLLTPKQQ